MKKIILILGLFILGCSIEGNLSSKSKNQTEVIFWEDGVFWGFFATQEGARTLNDALEKAYQLKEQAGKNVKATNEKLKTYRKSLTSQFMGANAPSGEWLSEKKEGH